MMKEDKDGWYDSEEVIIWSNFLRALKKLRVANPLKCNYCIGMEDEFYAYMRGFKLR